MKMRSIDRQIILSFVVLLFTFSLPSFAAEGCTYSGNKKIRIKISSDVVSVVDVKYCGGDDGGYVSIGMLVGKRVQRYKFPIYNLAYSVDIDSEIDLKNDGGHGLGVANGRGRSGDGMWYWVFDRKSGSYKYVGEAPRLHRSQANGGGLFAIESGGGDMQSVLYNYRVRNDRLALIGAVGFIPMDDVYEISLMTCTPVSLCKEVGRIKNVPAEQAQRCMSGTTDCDSL